MAVDDALLAWVREALGAENVAEVKMFGGVGFMLRGNMVVAASDRGLLVRVGPEAAPQALTRGGASAMEMRGRVMAGYVRVAPDALNARSVDTWVRLARAFVDTLPAKRRKAGTPKAAAKGKPAAKSKPAVTRPTPASPATKKPKGAARASKGRNA